MCIWYLYYIPKTGSAGPKGMWSQTPVEEKVDLDK